MPAAEVLEVAVSTPDRALAERLAAVLVAERLAACAQVSGPVASTYRWQGTVEQAQEWTCRAKTTAARLDALVARVVALHPYDTPEVLALRAAGGHPSYLAWVHEAVNPEPTEPGT